MTAVPVVTGRLARLIAPLRDAPGESAVLFDIDGTLAPIARHPGDAAVPEPTRQALGELAQRFGLVACVSGRRAAEARRLVGVPGLTYAGNHGLEVLRPGDQEAILDPAVAAKARQASDFVGGLDGAALGAGGLRLEDKGPIQALHWRGAADESAAERQAGQLANRARRAGLEPRWGRKVLELRPAARIDKGTAVRHLLDPDHLRQALFAGDDRTDLDAFGALHSLLDGGKLRVAVCLGIASEEAPEGLAEGADAVLDGPDELVEVIRALAASRASP